jgi:atypical dual specificity phosphatase
MPILVESRSLRGHNVCGFRVRDRVRNMEGFYWLIPRVLAGSGRPGARRNTPMNQARLDDDLTWLRRQNIEAILSMTEEPLDAAALERHNFVHLYLPVPDMTPPLPDQLADALAFIDRQTALGRGVLVHCLVGQGRTGTVLAAYLIRSGQTAEQAIAKIRVVCPHAVENALQETALAEFAARRDWLC